LLHNDEVFTELKIPAGRRSMTETESRVSALVGLTITLLFVVAILDEFSTRKLSIVFFMLFWIPMLVVHELGHAIAAKRQGDSEAFEHFRDAFAATNRSRSLARRVVALT
jgi:LytS/YehU family sensor histidine kinase